MEGWVESAAADIAGHAERELEALVAVSSPSGDVHGGEEAVAVCSALLPAYAEVERVPCSSPAHADDLVATVRGGGTRRLLLLGHLDTVFPHAQHRKLERDGERLYGSGTVDMKGGVVLAVGVLRALAARGGGFAEAALLLVNDEEWRTRDLAHVERFAGVDACLCFEAGQREPGGGEGVIVRRKAAGTLHVRAEGVSAHSGSAPEKGRNALVALAEAARLVAAANDPAGADRLTAVPTILSSGEAFNVVPAHGNLYCDLRADRLEAFDRVLDALPEEIGGAKLDAALVRKWRAMDAREETGPLLAAATELLGRPIVGLERGGASDASHMAARVPVTVDGLGARGGGAHTPEEFVLAESLRSRAEVALAVTAALLD